MLAISKLFLLECFLSSIKGLFTMKTLTLKIEQSTWQHAWHTFAEHVVLIFFLDEIYFSSSLYMINEWILEWMLNEFWTFSAILDARLFSFKVSVCSKIVLRGCFSFWSSRYRAPKWFSGLFSLKLSLHRIEILSLGAIHQWCPHQNHEILTPRPPLQQHVTIIHSPPTVPPALTESIARR